MIYAPLRKGFLWHMIFDAAIVDISHSSFLHFLLKRLSVFDTWAPALESLLFWESRGPEGAWTRFQRYLPESCHPPYSWFWSAAQGSQLPHQAAFWPLNHIFWGVMKISRCKFCLYLALFHICWTPCLPISCSSVWPRPHLCHIFTTKSAEKSNKESFQLFFQESQAAQGPTTERPACKFFTCFLRLVSGSAGAPAPIQCLLAARLPCSIFFWQHPENRLEPPPRPAFSPAFSAAGPGGSGGPALAHTSHMGDTWLCLLALLQLWMLSASC